MTVKQHLEQFLMYHMVNKLKFKTHQIQDLSSRSKIKWGGRLGSPETYTRVFRQIREDKVYNVMKLKSKSSNESTWFVRSEDD